MKTVIGLMVNVLAFGVSSFFVWVPAAVFNPNVDSGTLWLLVSALWLYVNREMYQDMKREGLL